MKRVRSAGLALWLVLASAVLYAPQSAGNQEAAPRVDAVVIQSDPPLCSTLPASKPRARPAVPLTPWIQGFFTGYNSHKPPGSRFILIDEHKHALSLLFDYCRTNATKTLVEASASVIEFYNKQHRAQQLIKPAVKAYSNNVFVATDQSRTMPVFSPGEPACATWMSAEGHTMDNSVAEYIKGFATANKVYGRIDGGESNDVDLSELIERTRSWCSTHNELVAAGIWEELKGQR